MRILTATHVGITSLTYSADSSTLYGPVQASSGPGELNVWHLGGEATRAETPFVGQRVWNCWPLADGRLLLGVTRSEPLQHRGTVAFVSATGSLNPLPLELLLCSVAITVHPTGDQFVFVDRSVYDADLQCHRFDGDTTQRVWRRPFEPQYSVGLGVQFDPTGERCLSTETYQNRTTYTRYLVARWRSAADGSPLGDPLPLTTSTCQTLLLADGSRLIAMAGAALLSYDMANPTAKPKKATSGNRLHFNGIAVHPHLRRVLAICNDQSVREYDAVTMKQIRAYDWKIGKLRCVAVAPDGLTAAAVGARRKVVVWDLE